MRRLLKSVGYKEKRIENAHIFHRSKNQMVIFRRYKDDESLEMGDIISTRRFLDMRGILDEAEFDSFFEAANKSA
jgi:hypothetical protein